MRDASKATYIKCKSEEGVWSMLEGQGLLSPPEVVLIGEERKR
jgi:hypothetical protein